MPSTNKILLRRLERLEDRLKEPLVTWPTQIDLVDAVTGEVGMSYYIGPQPPQAEDGEYPDLQQPAVR